MVAAASTQNLDAEWQVIVDPALVLDALQLAAAAARGTDAASFFCIDLLLRVCSLREHTRNIEARNVVERMVWGRANADASWPTQRFCS